MNVKTLTICLGLLGASVPILADHPSGVESGGSHCLWRSNKKEDPPVWVVPVFDYAEHWSNGPMVFVDSDGSNLALCDASPPTKKKNFCKLLQNDVIFLTKEGNQLFWNRRRGDKPEFTEFRVPIDTSSPLYMKIDIEEDEEDPGQAENVPRTIFMYYLGRGKCGSGYYGNHCHRYQIEVYPWSATSKAKYRPDKVSRDVQWLVGRDAIGECDKTLLGNPAEITGGGTRPP